MGVARFYDDGGGGMPGKSEDRPLLTVYLVNKAGLTDDQMKTVADTLAAPYQEAGVNIIVKEYSPRRTRRTRRKMVLYITLRDLRVFSFAFFVLKILGHKLLNKCLRWKSGNI